MDQREEAAFRACRNLIKAAVVVRRELDNVFASAGISGPQFGILMLLDTHGSMALGELGKRLWVSCGDVTGLVGKLVAAGYVRRARQPNDRRVIIADLTDEGRRLICELRPLHAECLARITVGMDEPDLRELSSLLEKLCPPAGTGPCLAAEPGGS